jgi:cell envelope opacity-associated protein A
MKKIFGALLICGLLTVPMAQAAKTKAPKVHQSKQVKKQAKVAKKANTKARKQAQRQAKNQAKSAKSA